MFVPKNVGAVVTGFGEGQQDEKRDDYGTDRTTYPGPPWGRAPCPICVVRRRAISYVRVQHWRRF